MTAEVTAERVLPSRTPFRIVWRLGLVAALVFVASFIWKEAKPAVKASIARRTLRAHHEEIVFAARESNLDPCLLAGMMRAESSGSISAISHKGALGLLQLMHSTAVERAGILGLEAPTKEDLVSDPLLNVRLGANYMAYLLEREEGNLEAALVAYNTGPFRLARWVREAGSYAAWREERMAAGNSDVLAYAHRVMRYRDEIARRGYFETAEEREEPEN